jgi:hypothetical protein
MAEPDAHDLARVARVWAGLPLDDQEAVALAGALEALRKGLDAMMSEELRNVEPPLLFRADALLR